MIEIIEGRGVGAGKSYYTCMRIMSHLAAGGTVFASDTFGLKWEATKALVETRWGLLLENDQFQTFPEGDIKRLHEVTPQGTPELPVLIVVDECHGELNARDWADKSKAAFFKWLTQSRHDDNDVIFISQSAHNIDKQIARLATYISRVRNMRNFSFPGIGKWPFRQFVINRFDQDGKTLLDRKWHWHDKGIFACYESKVMRGAHVRLSGGVPRKKLESVKASKNDMAKIVLVLMVILAGFAFWRFRNSPLLGGKPADVPARQTPAATQPGNPLPPSNLPAPRFAKEPVRLRDANFGAYDIWHEDFLGSARGELHTTDNEYREGRMSLHGLCVGIQDHVARIVQPDGRLGFVVADAFTMRKHDGVLDRSDGKQPPADTAPDKPAGVTVNVSTPADAPDGIKNGKVLVGGTVRNGKLVPYYAPAYTPIERARAGVTEDGHGIKESY